MNNTALLTALITSPSAAFAELRERPRFWLPLILLSLVSAGLLVWYYGLIDVAWLADRLVSTNERMANMPADARSRMASLMTRNTMMWSSMIGAIVAVPAVCALQALYYFLAGKVVGVQQSFKQWFTMICWTGLPAVLAAIASMMMLVTETSPMQLDPNQLQVLSLNELFFHIPFGAPGSTLLGSLTLVTPLSWLLTIIAVRTWTNRSWLFSATFALLPSVIWYGVWAFFAFK